ncbi:hypothetical protein D9613_012691 [Agrocybe pediades]|uniref:Uncharacterized protein n=1 Tax=Agrocybe pediades TaxID=84607 RepID=A0A8H4VJX3_9AGAR|nr:hypothetical protein D9613_012691 [Agrocybe pediades]
MNQTCILKPQGLKFKYEDASSTAIRLIVTKIMATALSSTSQSHISIPYLRAQHLVRRRYFFPGHDHDDQAFTAPPTMILAACRRVQGKVQLHELPSTAIPCCLSPQH